MLSEDRAPLINLLAPDYRDNPYASFEVQRAQGDGLQWDSVFVG